MDKYKVTAGDKFVGKGKLDRCFTLVCPWFRSSTKAGVRSCVASVFQVDRFVANLITRRRYLVLLPHPQS